MKDYDIHPDFLKFRLITAPMNAVLLPVIDFFLSRLFYRNNVPAELTQTRHTIAGHRGQPVRLLAFTPKEARAPMPALVYFHGGAFATQAAPHHKRVTMAYAMQTPCKVIFVDYRLVPGHPFPVGLEDCYAALRWTQQNAAQLGIDPARIAVGGDSAGGALAAGVCLLAKDRKTPMPCFQMLVYPVTDARQNTPSMLRFDDTPLWNSRQNARMWRIYLADGVPENMAYASPNQAPCLKSLPPTYVEVAAYDCLRDEGVDFAKNLEADGVSVVLRETERTVHGYDVVTHNGIARESINGRIAALRAAFYA